MPLQIRLWLMLLVAVNLVIPLFYIRRMEAQVVVGTFLISMLLMTLLTARFGFTRILGLGHILWLPLLYFLWVRLGDIPIEDFFGFWVRALIALDALSLITDVIDVFRYINGDRAEMV